jgi:hypothetical protein
MNIINSPELRVKQINMVNDLISNCQSIKDALSAQIAIDFLEKDQPNETTIITAMRSDLAMIVEELNNPVNQTN